MKDIVFTRKYTDNKGTERKEYITVGYMFEKEGRISLLMKNYINLSALGNEKGEVWLAAYEHKQKTEQAPKNEPAHTAQETVNQVAQAVGGRTGFDTPKSDEDVPF